jgi:hypothetical protein
MRLPAELHRRRICDWNYTIGGILEVWERARVLGCEEELERVLEADQGGSLTDLLARLGHECRERAVLDARQEAAPSRPRVSARPALLRRMEALLPTILSSAARDLP